jgi:hypothetical protein
MPAWERKFAVSVSGAGCEAATANVEEQSNLGLAEPVNGLHRIADEEDRPALGLVPSGGELPDEADLAERRVLELVDQNVADTFAQDQREVGRIFGLPQSGFGGEGDLSEIAGSGPGENERQFGGGDGQQLKQSFENPPLLAVVDRRGKIADLDQRNAESLVAFERSENSQQRVLERVARREAQPLVDSAAKVAFASQ